ncbi:MAG: HAMP domain-containing protein, partial [Rhizobiales bacterium]|nr:HAMP domain-containing protein [Rhizobacter sp.]
VLVALAYARVRSLLRPLADIRAGAIRYGAGDFSRPIPARPHDELGELAQQVNGMADGLHGMLDAKRQLLLAISHELRSPLTRARLNAELVEEGSARDALLHDLAEMRDLITDLLESERLTAGHAALHTEPGDLNALVRDVIDAQFAGRGIALALDAKLPATVLDATRIRLLLRNLLDNALRHSAGAPAPPQIATGLDGEVLRLTVRDHGPGVDDAQLPRLAQAFYRPDSARQRTTGGVGLGLYLCRLVALAHGGSLTLRNAHPGLEIEVHLPVRTG